MGVRVGKETEAKKMQGEIWSQSPDRRLHLDSSAGLPSVASLKNGHLANFCIPPPSMGSSVPHLSSSGLCLCSKVLPGRYFTPLGQGQPPMKSCESPGCLWGHRVQSPCPGKLRYWSQIMSPLDLFCCRQGIPSFSMQDLVYYSLFTYATSFE